MKIKYLAAIVVGLFLASCQSDPMFRSYVAAHRLSYQASEVLNQKLIVDNPAIQETDKAAFARKLEAERQMIESAEKALGVK
jgi:hypothetical protein